MAPRPYRARRRKAAVEATRQRIVDATVGLHAERGVLATSYAMIAERADVSIPTVYNHFPKLGDLLDACTGQAAAHAPPIGPEIFAGADDLEARLGALVDALFAQYAFYAPWLRWALHEAQAVPELATWLAQGDAQRRELLALALAPASGDAPPDALLALADALTDYPAWRRLAGDQAAQPARGRTTLVDALTLLARRHTPGDAARRTGPPPRRKGNRT